MKMKKILAAVLAGVMALSATACSSSSTKKIESPDDFAGAKVSVQTGTTAHDALQKMQEEGVDVEILPYEKITQCFDDVSLGRADAVYVDSVVAAYRKRTARRAWKRLPSGWILKTRCRTSSRSARTA